MGQEKTSVAPRLWQSLLRHETLGGSEFSCFNSKRVKALSSHWCKKGMEGVKVLNHLKELG